MLKLYVKFQNLMNREEGQGMVEYGLVVGLVALAVVGAVIALGGQLDTLFDAITGGLIEATEGSTVPE